METFPPSIPFLPGAATQAPDGDVPPEPFLLSSDFREYRFKGGVPMGRSRIRWEFQDPISWTFVPNMRVGRHILAYIPWNLALKKNKKMGLRCGRYLQSIGSWTGHWSDDLLRRFFLLVLKRREWRSGRNIRIVRSFPHSLRERTSKYFMNFLWIRVIKRDNFLHKDKITP